MSLKKFYYLLAILLMGASLLFVSCNNDDDEELLGDWEEGSDFDGVPRSEAVGFVIGDYAYLATGINLDKDRLKDLWYYNSKENYWVQKADMPEEAIARSAAVAFSAANKGFVGTGIDDNGDELKDFWMYEPDPVNAWTKIEDFPGSARYSAVAFSLNDKGYVGTGYDDNGETKEFYEYDPATGIWEQITYNGSKRYDACAFTIGTKAYLVSGYNNSYKEEFWEFDGATKKWTQLRDIADTNDDEDYDDDYTTIVRVKAVAFTVNGKGYIATGSNASSLSNVWEYDPTTDLWTEKTSFQGGSRTEAVGYGIGNYGYIATGRNSSSYFYDDIAIFDPSAEDDEVY